MELLRIWRLQKSTWIFHSLSRHLQENLRSSVHQLKLNRRWVMQQNSGPKDRSKSTTRWLQQKKIHLLEWPSQRPDLNPTEMLWYDLKRVIKTRHPKNKLKQFCKEEWSKIPPDRCAGLICNYLKHLVDVIAAKRRVNQILNPWVHILSQTVYPSFFGFCVSKPN